MHSKSEKMITIYLAFLPLLNVYTSGINNQLALGELLGLFILVVYFIRSDHKILKHRYWIFVLYLILDSIVVTLILSRYELSETIIRIAKMLFYTFLFLVIPEKKVDFSLFRKLIVNISIVVSLYIIIQYVSYIFFHISLPSFLPFLKILNENTSGSEFQNVLLSRYQLLGFRPSGVFTEPAAYCQYSIFPWCILLYKNNKEPMDLVKLLGIAVGIILSGSAIGYLCMVSILVTWLIQRGKTLTKGQMMLYIGITIVFAYVSIRFNLIEQVTYRISTTRASGATTGTLRLLRGLIIFEKVPFVFKIFGIGAGNYVAFIETFSISTMFDSTIPYYNEYMNMFSMILLYGGIIGMILYIFSIYKFFSKNFHGIMVAIFTVFLILGLSSNIFYSATYMILMLFAIYGERIQYNAEKEITG